MTYMRLTGAVSEVDGNKLRIMKLLRTEVLRLRCAVLNLSKIPKHEHKELEDI